MIGHVLIRRLTFFATHFMAIQLRCSSCQKVLQVADSAAGKKARCPGCQSIIDIPAASSPPASATPVAKPKQVAEPVKTAASSSSIKVTCQSCGKVLQAPSSAAGKGVRCPGCQSVVKIPGGASNASPSPSSGPVAKPKPVVPSPAAPKASAPKAAAPPTPAVASSTAGNALWDALGDIPSTAPTSSGWETPAKNPYASPASHGYSGSRRSSGGSSSNRTPYYIINGVIIALWGALFGVFWLLDVAIRIVALILLPSNLPQNVEINYPVLFGGIFYTILGIIASAIQLIGGIQMATRSNLSSARNAAVIAAIPCFGGLAFPFGIWAAVLTFSKQSERDFGQQ